MIAPPYEHPVLVVGVHVVVFVRVAAGLSIGLRVDLCAQSPGRQNQVPRTVNRLLHRVPPGLVRVPVIHPSVEPQTVIFHLTVFGHTCVTQSHLRAESEARTSPIIARRGRNVQGQRVGARCQCRVGEDLFARIVPVPVGVKVHPRVQVPARRGHHPQRVAPVRL